MMTIGHSTLPLEVFLQALKDNGCRRLIDVRSIPRSRHNPQFEQPALFVALEEAGISAVWRKALGGRRHTRKDSINLGWRNESFRGYADYMQTPEFAAQIDWLMALPHLDTTAVMCAEAVPWRCHRSLVSDALSVRGIPVIEIMSEKSYRPHKLTPFAHVSGTEITYPPEQAELF